MKNTHVTNVHVKSLSSSGSLSRANFRSEVFKFERNPGPWWNESGWGSDKKGRSLRHQSGTTSDFFRFSIEILKRQKNSSKNLRNFFFYFFFFDFCLLRMWMENLGLVAIGLNAFDTSPVEIDIFSSHDFYSE